MAFNRTILMAGAFAGLGTVLWTLFEFAMGWHGPRMEVGAKTGFVGILFPVAAIIWALRTTRDELGGRITLGESLLVGLSIALILSAIGIVFYQIYYTRINPEFLERLRASGTPTTVLSQLVTVVAGSVVFSLIVALIGGLLLRRSVPPGAG